MKDYTASRKARKNYICTGCGGAIEKGTSYLFVDKPFGVNPKYHADCAPKPETETRSEVQVAETIETTSDPTDCLHTPEAKVVEVPKIQRPRDSKGHFVRVY